MKLKHIALSAAATFMALTLASPSLLAGNSVQLSPNGIALPEGYKDWKVISISHRGAGNTNPWPKGSILGKLVWKQKAKESWSAAIAPDKFVHAEFMFKDSVKYKSTGGWGYARWKGLDQKPHGKDKNFAQECVECHKPVKDNDWVFTTPASMP